MALKINLSFKEGEIELYNFIKSQRSPSNFVKDCVDFYRKYNAKDVKVDTPKTISEEKISELLDF